MYSVQYPSQGCFCCADNETQDDNDYDVFKVSGRKRVLAIDDATIQANFEAADINKDNQLNEAEFKSYLGTRSEEVARFGDRFGNVDSKKSDRVSLDEVKQFELTEQTFNVEGQMGDQKLTKEEIDSNIDSF